MESKAVGVPSRGGTARNRSGSINESRQLAFGGTVADSLWCWTSEFWILPPQAHSRQPRSSGTQLRRFGDNMMKTGFVLCVLCVGCMQSFRAQPPNASASIEESAPQKPAPAVPRKIVDGIDVYGDLTDADVRTVWKILISDYKSELKLQFNQIALLESGQVAASTGQANRGEFVHFRRVSGKWKIVDSGTWRE